MRKLVLFALCLLAAAGGCDNFEKAQTQPSAEGAVFQFSSTDALRKIEGVALIDFTAAWCHPCKIQGPVVAEVAETLKGKVAVGMVDVDQQPDIARAFAIQAMPTLIILKDGREAERLVGLRDDPEELAGILERHYGMTF